MADKKHVEQQRKSFMSGLQGRLNGAASGFHREWIAAGGDGDAILPIDEFEVIENGMGFSVVVLPESAAHVVIDDNDYTTSSSARIDDQTHTGKAKKKRG